MKFEWDDHKNRINLEKHEFSFEDAVAAFDDPQRIIQKDEKHSGAELRAFCFGKVDGEIITVRFTLRDSRVRIFGAGHWRKGEKIYEKINGK